VDLSIGNVVNTHVEGVAYPGFVRGSVPLMSSRRASKRETIEKTVPVDRFLENPNID